MNNKNANQLIESSFPQKDRKLFNLEEYIFFSLMDDMATKISAYNAIPSVAPLIHLVFQKPRYYFLLAMVLHWLFKRQINKLNDFGEFIIIHVGGLDDRFQFLSAHLLIYNYVTI